MVQAGERRRRIGWNPQGRRARRNLASAWALGTALGAYLVLALGVFGGGGGIGGAYVLFYVGWLCAALGLVAVVLGILGLLAARGGGRGEAAAMGGLLLGGVLVLGWLLFSVGA